MKNFLLGVSVCALLSFTAIKPAAAAPQTIVKSFSSEDSSDGVAFYVRQKIQEGWRVKEIAAANAGGYHSTWIVILEK